MRRLLAFGSVFVTLAATATPTQAAKPSCRTPLPVAPSGLPAAVVLQTVCGAYEVDRAGRVTATRPSKPPWWSTSPFQVDVRRHHVVLFAHGKLRWRSRHTFPMDASQLGSVAFEAHRFAFSFMGGKLWVARLDGAEHAVARNEWAIQWTRRGELVTGRVRSKTTDLLVRRADGTRPRLIAARRNVFLADEWTKTLLYVGRDGTLVRADGRTKTVLASLPALRLPRNPEIQLPYTGLIVLSTTHRVVVLRADGGMFASTRYPDRPGLEYGYPSLAVGAARVAIAVDLWEVGGTGVHKREALFVLRAGDTNATPLLEEEGDYFGCGWTVTLAWHGPWLLYTDALLRVIALDASGERRVDLSATAQNLPGVASDPAQGGYTGFDFALWGSG